MTLDVEDFASGRHQALDRQMYASVIEVRTLRQGRIGRKMACEQVMNELRSSLHHRLPSNLLTLTWTEERIHHARRLRIKRHATRLVQRSRITHG